MSDNVFSVATTTLIIDRPSVLCISDADDDDKALWIVEATKALLPQEEGNFQAVRYLLKARTFSEFWYL